MSKSKTILCVDDELAVLSMRMLMFEAQGYHVLTAENGPDGLSIFGSKAIDLVVLDYKMPGMDGHAVARAMKRIRPNVPIILLSAYIDLPDELLTLVNKSLTKAEDPIVLLTIIEELLDSTSQSIPNAG